MEYTQIKVSVNPDLASAFKAACASAGVSMASALTGFMSGYCRTAASADAPYDVSTRRLRRKAIKRLVLLLERVKDAEARYRDNIPENLRSSSVYDSADESVSVMEEALEMLASAL